MTLLSLESLMTKKEDRTLISIYNTKHCFQNFTIDVQDCNLWDASESPGKSLLKCRSPGLSPESLDSVGMG